MADQRELTIHAHHRHHRSDVAASTATFPTDPSGLPEAGRPALLELVDGDTLHLRVGPVAKQLGNTTVRMLGYNGSIPGPTLKVQQGSEIIVHVTNEGDLDTTVHWHGLRLENRYDGVPHETQAPVPVGGEFSYRIQFPDPGLYWYHPHIREDYTQELGLYGNILVVPADPDYWPPADRDFVLTLDDLLLETARSRRSVPPRPVMRPWAASQRVFDQRRPGTAPGSPSRGSGTAVADQHRQYPGVQRGVARSADEAHRRRQRPL
jgi:FtsP/CotA-like multicopper oxidase with cupredoxin domain